MKKTILLLIAMMVIIVGFLSGCDETTSNDGISGDSANVEIVNYKIETFGADMGSKPEKIGDGFIYQIHCN